MLIAKRIATPLCLIAGGTWLALVAQPLAPRGMSVGHWLTASLGVIMATVGTALAATELLRGDRLRRQLALAGVLIGLVALAVIPLLWVVWR